MASVKYIERTNTCSEKLAICQKLHQILEHFVIISYDQSSAGQMVNEARSDIIAHRQKPYEIIIPSRNRLQIGKSIW